MSDAVHRPIGVAIVAVVAFLSGVIDIISGIVLIFRGNDPEVSAALAGSGGVLAASIGSMVLGLIVVVLAFGLWLGHAVSQMVVTVLQALSLIQSLFLAVAALGEPTWEWASIVISAVVMILLWTPSAKAYFNGQTVATR
ncbi:MAG TPA: hypothetical protein VI121_04495 [Agromyces sp.]